MALSDTRPARDSGGQAAPLLHSAGRFTADDEWLDTEMGEPLKSCTMIVTAANELVARVHDRMPVPLAPKDFEPWLSCEAGTEQLRPASDDALQV